MSFVVDASVVTKWFVEERDRDAARDLEDEDELIAPDFLLVEMANLLWKIHRRGGIELDRARNDLRSLGRGVPTLHETPELVASAFDLAAQLQHPVYDCLYLALGLRKDTQVVTADRRFHDRVMGSEYRGRTWLLGDE